MSRRCGPCFLGSTNRMAGPGAHKGAMSRGRVARGRETAGTGQNSTFYNRRTVYLVRNRGREPAAAGDELERGGRPAGPICISVRVYVNYVCSGDIRY